MRKMKLLALLMVLALAMSGCALVTVDEKADNAQVIVRVNGETVDKETVKNAVNNTIAQNEYMNQAYAMYGIAGSAPTDTATVQSQVISSYVSTLVARQKAAELGLDQMTEEEQAEIEESAKAEYHEYLHQVAQAYVANYSDLEEEEMEAEAEKYIAEYDLATMDDFLLSASREKANEKLRADAVKDVAVTEEELAAELENRVSQAQANYETNPDQYGTAVNGGNTVYYAPAGYRYVKQILVKLNQEDSDAITEKERALRDAQTALTAAQEALDAAESDDGALQAALTEAQQAVEEAQKAVDEATEAAFANIQQKTDEIYALATAEGADFDALVAEYNEDAGMPEVGYAVREGYGSFVTSFVDAAMGLENIGDVSQPTRSNYGYHILRYSADIAEGAVALDAVRDTLESELLSQKQDDTYADALEKWISEADVKTFPEKMN